MILEKFVMRDRPEVSDILCDICEESCKIEDTPLDDEFSAQYEYAYLAANWGYHSHGKDGEAHRCHLCEKCYEKVRSFIEKELKGKIMVEQTL